MNPLRVLCLVSLLLASAGCAGFRGGELTQVSPWPLTPLQTKKSVSLSVAGSMSMNDKPGDVSPAMLSNWHAEAERAYKQSGLFQNVVPQGTPADLRAEIRVVDAGHGSQFLSFISGLTLFIIPSRAEDRVTVRTQFKNAKGDVLGTYEKSDSAIVWFHLFMAPAMPFLWPPTVTEELFRDLHQTTLAEAHAKGIF